MFEILDGASRLRRRSRGFGADNLLPHGEVLVLGFMFANGLLSDELISATRLVQHVRLQRRVVLLESFLLESGVFILLCGFKPQA